jgi:hypothetical protein
MSLDSEADIYFWDASSETLINEFRYARLVKILVGPLSAYQRIPQRSMMGLCHERSIALGTPFGLCYGPG